MEKQKQIDGRHRNCTEANCTPNTQVCPVHSKSHCHFGLGHPYWHDPMWFLSPAHYTLNTLGSTRQEVFQLLLFDPSNNWARRRSSFGFQAHSFPSFPTVLLLLQDIIKVLNFQGSVSDEPQPAFSTCATIPSTSFAKPKASTNMCLLCKTWLPAAHSPRKASGAIITTAALGIPCPTAELSCSPGALSVWHQV